MFNPFDTVFKGLPVLIRANCRKLALCALVLISACSAPPSETDPFTPIGSIPSNTPSATDSRLIPSPTDISSGLPPADTQPSPTYPSLNYQETIESQPVSVRSEPSPTLIPYPAQTSDLLYISDGALKRWDYVTNFTVALVDGVEEFSVSNDGSKIILLRPRKITANGVQMYDLDIFDFETKQITNWFEESPRLFHILLSPDGTLTAYTTQENGGELYVIDSAAPEDAIKIGTHEGEFKRLVWAPDSSAIIWNDSHGIWGGDPQETGSHLIHPNFVEVYDPKGNKSEIEVDFEQINWSPLGRYVLTRVVPSDSNVSWYAVLDSVSGRLEQIQDSYETGQATVGAGWNNDGSLYIGRSGDPAQQTPPFIQRWHLLATHDDLLLPGEVYPIISDEFPFETSRPGRDSSLCLNWLLSNRDDSLNLGVTLPDTNMKPALFYLDWEDGSLHKLFTLPNNPMDILWSLDGGGALTFEQSDKILFIQFSSGLTFDLRPVLGENAHSFTWLPPAPRH